MRHSLWIAAACAILAACQAGPQSDTQTSEAALGSGHEATDEVAPDEAPEEAAPTDPDDEVVARDATPDTLFAVHEWGLIRITSEGAELATSAFDARPTPTPTAPQQIEVQPPDPPRPEFVQPPRPDRPMQTRKPIIYLHALEGFDASTSITLSVSIAQGYLHEVWPAELDVISALRAAPANLANGAPVGGAHTFGPLTIGAEGCDTSMVPTLETPFCAAVTAGGGVCETAEMREYLQPVPSCLQTPQGPAPVLLYNGLFTTPITPVTMAYDAASTTATVTNTSAHAVGPLWAVSLDNNEGTGRHYHRIERLEPGASQTLAWADATFHEGQHDLLLADIRAALLAQGLTDGEANDFMQAWSPDVLAPRAPDQINPIQPWTAFGFYSQAFIAEQLPMTITPTPQSLSRVIAFSLED